jgi:hypothetical protein
MEPGGSLPYSQNLTTEAYVEQVKFSSDSHRLKQII